MGAGDEELPAVRQTLEYRDFAAKLHWMRATLDSVCPIETSYPWCIYLLSGFTLEEVDARGGR